MAVTVSNKQIIGEGIKRLDLKAPEIAGAIQPGQYILIQPDAACLPVAVFYMEADSGKGQLSVAFEENSVSTRRLGEFRIGETLYAVQGPLGVPLVLKKTGPVACVGFGIGIADILPICRRLKKLGNRVVGVFGAPSKKKMILEFQTRLSCHSLKMATEDGSYEFRGTIAEAFKEVIERDKVRAVFASGPCDRLKDVCRLARSKKVPAWVFLKPGGLDPFGRSLADWVDIGGRSFSVALDGPVFEDTGIDFDGLLNQDNFAQELMQWHGQIKQKNSPESVSGTLPKFLTGLRKNRP